MKVSIVGVGHVGSSLGVALVAQGIVDEIVLVGRRVDVAVGEAMDLQHAAAFVAKPIDVRAGTVADTDGSDVVCLCVAGKVPEGGDRKLGVGVNAAVLRELVPPLAAANPKAVFVVTTNPLDAMTTLALRVSGLPAAQVIGSGTLLDTMRLRVLLSNRCDIHPHDIRAYVLGEHGDSQFAALSSASSGGARLPLDDGLMRSLAAETVDAGHEIYRRKGHTNHGVAFAAAAIVRAIALDAKEVMPVCTLVEGFCDVTGVCLSVPAVIGKAGVVRTLNVELTPDEQAAFRRSADVVKQTLRAAGA